MKCSCEDFPGGSVGKVSACNVGDWVRSLGWEDPLEKGKGTHSSILAWRIPWTVQSMRSQRVVHDWETFIFTFIAVTVSGGQQRHSATHTHTHTHTHILSRVTIVDLLTYVQIISMRVIYHQTQNIINVFYVYLCANHNCVSFTIRLKTFFFFFL